MGACLFGRELLRTKGTSFYRRLPDPPFAQLMPFLRRARWAVLWKLTSDQSRASSALERSELAEEILDEASVAYAATPEDLERVEELFALIGSSLPSDAESDAESNAEFNAEPGMESDAESNAEFNAESGIEPEVKEDIERHADAFLEGMIGTGIVYEWLCETPGFGPVGDDDTGWLGTALLLAARQGAAIDDEVSGGLTGLPGDEGLARALDDGDGNFAVCALMEIEELAAKQVVALDVEDFLVDALGAVIRLRRTSGGLFSKRKVHVAERRITPYTRIALERALAGRDAGALLVDANGDRLTEFVAHFAYLQAFTPQQVSGPPMRF